MPGEHLPGERVSLSGYLNLSVSSLLGRWQWDRLPLEPGDFDDGQVDQRRVGDGLQDGHEAQRIPGQQVMVQQWEAIEIDIDGRTFWVRPVGSWVLESGNVVAQALAVSLDKPLEWGVGFFFGNVELSLELWTVISGISGFDD